MKSIKSLVAMSVITILSLSGINRLEAQSPASSYSGRAFVADITVGPIHKTIIDTGPLPSTGGTLDVGLINTNVLTLGHLEVLHAYTQGEGPREYSEASVANGWFIIANNSIYFEKVMAKTLASCSEPTVQLSGFSVIVGLIVNGQPIYVTGKPNQRIDLLAGGVLIINEQFQSTADAHQGEITVNALHITIPNLANIIVSSAYSGVVCTPSTNTSGGGTTPTPPPPSTSETTDLVFQNVNGSQAVWHMVGTNCVGTEFLANGLAVPQGWTLVGQADLNLDGYTDLIWQNVNGKCAVWLMNGTTLISSQLLRSGLAVGTAWKIVSVGDLNNDGKTDLLFQNTDGRLVVWYLNGTTYIGSASLRTVSSGWRVVEMSDMNGDGLNDLLFESSTGKLAVWYMNNTTLTSSALLRNGLALPTGWHLNAVADLNNDGSVDLLLQQDAGKTAVWYMNGTSVVDSDLLRGGLSVGTNWRLVSAQ